VRAAVALVVRASARRQLDLLTSALFGPLRAAIRAAIGDRDLLVVPTDALSGLPWGLLPDLRGRPVTVAPSATAWLHGQRTAPAPSAGPPLLIAGPDLDHARTVVSAVGRIPDDSVADVMYAYHRALAGGAPPARALADCTGDGTLMPFACFGAG